MRTTDREIAVSETMRELEERLRRAEAKAEAADARLESTLESITDGFITFDRDWRCTYANDAAARIIGRSKAEILGKVLWEEVPEAVGTLFHTEALHALEDGQPRSLEVYFPAWDRWFSDHLYPSAGGLTLIFNDITERKKTDDALRLSERRFRSLFENSLYGIFLTSPDGSILAANPEACRLLGMTEQEIVRAGRDGIVVQDDRLAAAIAERERTGRAHAELTYRRKDGTTFPVEVASAVWQDVDGSRRTSMIVRDLTEQKRAEEARRENESRLRFIVENSPDATFIQDRDLRYVWVGRASFPFTREDILGRTDLELLSPEEGARLTELKKRVLEGERVMVELPMAPKGEHRVYEATYEPWRDAAGAIIGVAGYAHDITERKRTEQDLRESEQRFRIMGETVDYGVWLCNKDGGAEYVSQSFLDLLDMTQEEQRQFGWTRRLPLEDVEPTKQKWLHCVRTGETWDSEHRIIDRHGQIHTILTRGKPVRDEKGEIQWWVGVNLDITARKRMEEELRRAKAEAESASKAKSQFLANMSHELRTPMNAIIGMTELALEEELSPTVRDMLVTAKDSADTLLELLNDILDLSRIESGRIQLEQTEFCLRDLVDKTIKALGLRAFQKGLELVSSIPTDVPDRLVGDPMRLRQVLVNLLGNAIKFTSSGEVVLGAALVERDHREAVIELSVRDTGIGISEADQERIFRPFTQADASITRQYGGTGLGLTISRRLVALMGGELRVDSRLGSGSTFGFTARFATLPEACETTDVTRAAREQLRDVPILLVEDNGTSRHSLEQLLAHWSMKPEAVSDVPLALARLHQATTRGTPFSLVLASAQLPSIDGFTLAEWIKGEPRLARAVVLMVSPLDRQESRRRCEELGAFYLEKPVSQSSLLAAILSALGLRTRPVESALQPAPHRETTAGEKPPRRLRALIAEDTPANQKLASLVLERRGHAVEVVQNGQQAVELVRTSDFDVVLMDVQMPVMDGYQATAAIRALDTPEKSRVPIVAMTAHALKGDAERCLAAGMDAYVSKPIDAQELLGVVERLGGHPEDAGSTPPVNDTRQLPVRGAATGSPSAETFDSTEAMRTCYGQEHMFREMVESFFEEQGPLLEQMRAALERGDGTELAAAAHRLKNTVVYLGARPTVEATQRLVELGRASDLTEAAAALEELEERLAELTEALGRDTRSEGPR